ncbi:hypothetical protein LPJ61_004959, partial [Coemansia biformis]
LRSVFGGSLGDPHGSHPRYVSIYTCANYTGNFGALYRDCPADGSPRLVGSGTSSSDSFSSSAQVAYAESRTKLSSLEGGQWEAAVASCRSIRAASQLQADDGNCRVSRLFVYPLAYVAVWLPSLVYCIVSTYVYHAGFAGSGPAHARRSVDMSSLPAHWTAGMNANRAWPYYRSATEDVRGSAQLYWLAIIQALHLLNGAADAVLFWLTEDTL